jgi:hypothetical protein
MQIEHEIMLSVDREVLPPDAQFKGGVRISSGQIAHWLTQDQSSFHEEEEATYRASLAACSGQHMDETGTCVVGENRFCHIVTSPLATHDQTQTSKSRLSVIACLPSARAMRLWISSSQAPKLTKLPC